MSDFQGIFTGISHLKGDDSDSKMPENDFSKSQEDDTTSSSVPNFGEELPSRLHEEPNYSLDHGGISFPRTESSNALAEFPSAVEEPSKLTANQESIPFECYSTTNPTPSSSENPFKHPDSTSDDVGSKEAKVREDDSHLTSNSGEVASTSGPALFKLPSAPCSDQVPLNLSKSSDSSCFQTKDVEMGVADRTRCNIEDGDALQCKETDESAVDLSNMVPREAVNVQSEERVAGAQPQRSSPVIEDKVNLIEEPDENKLLTDVDESSIQSANGISVDNKSPQSCSSDNNIIEKLSQHDTQIIGVEDENASLSADVESKSEKCYEDTTTLLQPESLVQIEDENSVLSAVSASALEDDSSIQSTGTASRPRTPSRKRQLNNVIANELGIDAAHKEITADQVYEYQWPQHDKNAEWHMLQEQVSSYLGVLSFKRKYPDLTRRPVEFNERLFLRDKGVVTETQCDLGLTVLRSEEVYELVSKDYPDKYKELVKVLHKREKERLADKRKHDMLPVEKDKMSILVKRAIKKAADFNSQFMRERREERKSYFDLQTMEVHYPKGRMKKLPGEATAVSPYPCALIPGQFQDYYKSYTSQELRYFPLNTAMYSPHKSVKSIYANPNKKSKNVNSDSDNSDADAASSDGTGTSDTDIDSDLEKAFDDTEAQEAQAGEDIPHFIPKTPLNKAHLVAESAEVSSTAGSESSRSHKKKSKKSSENKTPLTSKIKVTNVRTAPKVTVRLMDLMSSAKKKYTVEVHEPQEEHTESVIIEETNRDVALCNVCTGTSARNKLGESEELVKCSVCNSHGHPSCLELTSEMVPVIHTYPWQCMECKTCAKCKDPYDEDKMMFCDHCDRGYHTFCVGLKSIPTGRWECPTCRPDDTSQLQPPKKKAKQK